MTLDRWSGGNVWGTVHPRSFNSVTKFFGSSEKAVGGSRTMGYLLSDGRFPGVWPKHGVKTKASSTRESVAPSFISDLPCTSWTKPFATNKSVIEAGCSSCAVEEWRHFVQLLPRLMGGGGIVDYDLI
jgi:hypothetical protein